MSRKLFAGILMCFLFSGDVSAQKLYFSNIPRLNSKAYYNKVIGENPGGMYVLRFRDAELKSGFSIERYSNRLDYTQSQNFYLARKDKLLKVMTTDSGLFLIKSTNNKGTTVFTWSKLNYALAETVAPVPFYSTQSMEKSDDAVFVEYSLNRKYVGLWTEETNDKGDQVFHCCILTTGGTLVGQSSLQVRAHWNDVVLEQTAVSDTGTSAMVFLQLRTEKKNTEPAYEEHFICGVSGNTMYPAMTLTDHHFFLPSYDLVWSQYTHSFCLNGLFDFNKNKSAHGVFGFTYNPGDAELHPYLTPLSRSFVANLIGASDESAGEDPLNFYVRKIVPRSDGGVLLICEYFEITQQMETFYMNGVPQVSTKNIYNYNEVIFLALNAKGEIEWEHVHNKLQSSYASLSYLSGIGIYVCDKQVNVVYNDNTGQNNRVMHISLSRDGVVEQKILLNGENEYAAIIPGEGRQTGYNRYVAPLVQNRQTSLIELVQEEK